ncbi:MAG: hypothetical protein IJU39_01530 [Clostridia bacterium]|nr:hypothetical protein [Clostridia bacterium]
MKKYLSIILAVLFIFSVVTVFSACGKTDDDTDVTDDVQVVEDAEDAEEAEVTSADEEETTVDENLPKSGDKVELGKVSVTIPDGWYVEEYTEGEEIDIRPDGAFLESVTISVNNVYGGDHAKEWADNINGNYGGDNEIDNVDIAGKSFYRVKAKEDQNICFTDIDDSTYLKVSVMFMDWADGEAVLSAIEIG